MCKVTNEMSRSDKDRVFGVAEPTKANTGDLECRYAVEHGEEGEANYLKQQVLRNQDGNYYLAAKGGANATLGFGAGYCLDGREMLIPIRPEALTVWAMHELCGDEYEQAMKEFGLAPGNFRYETVGQYQQGDTYELLWRTTDNLYILLSTDAAYPCLSYNTPLYNLDEDGICRDDLYLYYVTPETARRWAEARGITVATWKESNDSARQFFEELERQFAWDLLPFDFLYALYKSWFRRNNPTGTVLSRNSFIHDIVAVAKGSQIWSCNDPRTQIRTSGRITCPEPLIRQYDLREWMGITYHNGNKTQAAMPVLKSAYRGLLRRPDAPRSSSDSGSSPE